MSIVSGSKGRTVPRPGGAISYCVVVDSKGGERVGVISGPKGRAMPRPGGMIRHGIVSGPKGRPVPRPGGKSNEPTQPEGDGVK